jgi:hypothetical protein
VEQDSEDEAEKEEKKRKNKGKDKEIKDIFDDEDDDDDDDDNEAAQELKNEHLRAVQLMNAGDDDDHQSDEEQKIADKKFKAKMKRRARKRKEGHSMKVSHRSQKDEVQKARQIVAELSVIDDAEKQRQIDFKKLGFGACSACMTNPCKCEYV